MPTKILGYSKPYLVKIYCNGLNYNGTSVNGWLRLPMTKVDGYDFTDSTIVNNGRNASGILIASVIRSGFFKVEMQYSLLNPEITSTLLKQFEDSNESIYTGMNGSFIHFTKVYSPILNNYIIRKAYVGDRKPKIFLLEKDSDGFYYNRGWKDLPIHLIGTGEKQSEWESKGETTPQDTESNNYYIRENGTIGKATLNSDGTETYD